jgi:hypothetical protein
MVEMMLKNFQSLQVFGVAHSFILTIALLLEQFEREFHYASNFCNYSITG